MVPSQNFSLSAETCVVWREGKKESHLCSPCFAAAILCTFGCQLVATIPPPPKPFLQVKQWKLQDSCLNNAFPSFPSLPNPTSQSSVSKLGKRPAAWQGDKTDGHRAKVSGLSLSHFSSNFILIAEGKREMKGGSESDGLD